MKGIIRKATESDAEAVCSIYNHYVRSSIATFETTEVTQEKMRDRMKKFMRWGFFIYESGGTILGYAYGGPHLEREAYRWSCNASVYVDPSAQRKGIGHALYSELFPLLKSRGLKNVYGGISLPNAASISLHEKMGLKQISTYKNVGYKLGAWHDVGWWHLQLGEYEKNPAEPRLGD